MKMTIDRFYKAQEALRLMEVTGKRLQAINEFAERISSEPTTVEIAVKTGIVGDATVFGLPIIVQASSLKNFVEEHKEYWQAKLESAQKQFDEV